jgi:hypothetical protein
MAAQNRHSFLTSTPQGIKKIMRLQPSTFYSRYKDSDLVTWFVLFIFVSTIIKRHSNLSRSLLFKSQISDHSRGFSYLFRDFVSAELQTTSQHNMNVHFCVLLASAVALIAVILAATCNLSCFISIWLMLYIMCNVYILLFICVISNHRVRTLWKSVL